MPDYLIPSQPPIYTTNIMYNGRLTTSWQRWFNSVYTTHTQHFKVYGKDADKNNVPLLVHTQMTTAERDALVGVENGATIYNTTTNAMNWYENGAWVTK